MGDKSCLQCGERVQRLKSLFCKDYCRRAYKKSNLVLPRAACKMCQTMFSPKKSNHMFCSKVCATTHYKQNHPKRESAQRRRYALMANYGITPEQWESLFNSQGRRCAICKEATAERWVTDHNHDTGAVRGILCSTCNLGLGYFKDNLENLHEAAVYLLSEHSLLEGLSAR